MSASTRSGLIVSAARHLEAARQAPMMDATLIFIVLDYLPRLGIVSCRVRYLGEDMRNAWQCREPRYHIRLHRVLWPPYILCCCSTVNGANVTF